MEYPAKMMSQHFTSMLEHLKVSSLINKTRSQASSSNTITTSQQQNSDSKVKSYGTDDIDNHKIIKNNGTVPILIENHTNNSSIKYESNSFNDTKITNVVNSIPVNSCKENNQLQQMQLKEINSAGGVVVNNFESNKLLGIDTNISVRRNSSNTLNACPMTGQQSRKQSYVIKPIKLKNVSSQQECYDTLYTRATEVSF